MTNAHFAGIEQYDDVESKNYYRILRDSGVSEADALEVLAQRSRDNARTPMQWTGGENAEFTSGKSWLGIPANYTNINAEAEEADPDSILNYYRQLVRLRQEHPVIAEGSVKFLETGNDDVLAYERRLGDEHLVVICNFSGE